MIKLFATDMDHTLLDADSNLPVNFEKRVRDIQEKGKKFALVSGRSYDNIRHKVGEFADDIIIISDNGALVVDKGELIHHDHIPGEDIKAIIDKANIVPETTIIAASKDMAYVQEGKYPEHLDFLNEFYNVYQIVDDLRDINDDIVKITLLTFENNLYNFNTYIDGQLPESVISVMSGTTWIDIVSNTVHKARGIQQILNRYEIDKKELVAFGDYLNDLTMIKMAGTGYVVSNGHDKLKQVATEIIGRHDEDAVMSKIEALIK